MVSAPLLAIGYQLSAIGYQLLAIGRASFLSFCRPALFCSKFQPLDSKPIADSR
jgi:hypothetical protein